MTFFLCDILAVLNWLIFYSTRNQSCESVIELKHWINTTSASWVCCNAYKMRYGIWFWVVLRKARCVKIKYFISNLQMCMQIWHNHGKWSTCRPGLIFFYTMHYYTFKTALFWSKFNCDTCLDRRLCSILKFAMSYNIDKSSNICNISLNLCHTSSPT